MKTAELRVTHETAYDVVVVGGGPAGLCAGLASTRLGMKTLLVEKAACLGGEMTSGLHPLICGWQPHLAPVPAVRGLPAELTDRVCAFYDDKRRSFFDPELTKHVAEQMLLEAGAAGALCVKRAVAQGPQRDSSSASIALTRRIAIITTCLTIRGRPRKNAWPHHPELAATRWSRSSECSLVIRRISKLISRDIGRPTTIKRRMHV